MTMLIAFLKKVISGIGKAFITYPVAMLCNVIFALVTSARIYYDWPILRSYEFLLDSIQLACLAGALGSMALVTWAQSRWGYTPKIKIIHLVSFGLVLIIFAGVYIWGGRLTGISDNQYLTITELASARVFAVSTVSLLLFIIFAGAPVKAPQVDRSFFMTQKAFFIALIYGIVLWLGTAGVARAIEVLLYQGLSSDIYGYLGITAGFLAFTFFISYFPSFYEGAEDVYRQNAEQQPKFIIVLFNYILVPVLLALTLVLLVWTVQTIGDGSWQRFERLAWIAAGYTVFGIWLHLMVASYDVKPATFYKKLYPFAALIILATEAYVLYAQVQRAGLGETEYWFSVVWLLTVFAAVGLLWRRPQIYRDILFVACALTMITVMPLIGYNDLPVAWQVKRVERLLQAENLLINNQLQPAQIEISETAKAEITETILFLAKKDNAQIPAWLTPDLKNNSDFQAAFGFNQTHSIDPHIPSSTWENVYLYAKNQPIMIDGYQWSVQPEVYGSQEEEWQLTADTGTYTLYWRLNETNGVPTIELRQAEKSLLKESLSAYSKRLLQKYPLNHGGGNFDATLADLSVVLENPQAKVYIVFEYISLGKKGEQEQHRFTPQMIYIQIK